MRSVSWSVIAVVAAFVLAVSAVAVSPAAAVTADGGDVWTWGRNQFGQLGNGTTAPSTEPGSTVPIQADLPEGTTATAVAGGYGHSVALTSTGQVLAWGQNDVGQLGDGTFTDSTTPVQVQLPAGSTATAIASGDDFVVALTSTGELLAWGYNQWGQLGNGVTGGESNVPVHVNLPAGTTATAVSCGAGHCLALTAAGEVLAWGDNDFGQLGDGTVVSRNEPVPVNLPAGTTVTSIAGGDDHSLALTSTGQVYAWGYNGGGQLGNGTTTNSSTPVLVHLPTGITVTSVAAAHGFQSFALTAAGEVLAWGDNTYGQLGDGTTTRRTEPVLVHLPTGTTVTSIAGGDDHTVALTSTGQVLAWGYNRYGQVGDGTTTNRTEPVPVELPDGAVVTAIGAGNYHSLAVFPSQSAAESATTLTAHPATAGLGEPVVLTAQVTCTAGTPTGEVAFYDGDTQIGTATLDAEGTATLTTADLALGAHQITAHYQGDDTCPPSVSDPVAVIVEEVPHPSLALTKQAESTGPFQVGDTVRYAYTVANTGNTALHDVTVTDDKVAAVTCDTTTLAPGASTACRGGHVITEADITPCEQVTGGCELTNLAQATALEPTGQEVASEQATAAVTVEQQPRTSGLTLAKRVASQGPFQVGDTVRYAYTVTNTGDTTLTGVTVHDNHVTQVTCGATTLAPGASTTCQGSHVITRTNLQDCHPATKKDGHGSGGTEVCSATNTATAAGTAPDGHHVVSQPARATITVTAKHPEKPCHCRK
ncbi:Ig-like domain repeat protein [Streptomyces sp. NPDC058195]|uniref:RCC1 domain-containing protein n=1 Tax=Streptomyces sp. NPDC058195 TaxID=3346375 RepID=UPI0036ECFD35